MDTKSQYDAGVNNPAISIVSAGETAEEWDDFATACGGSFLTTFRASWARQWDHHVLYHLYRLSFYIDAKKIGQVAIGYGWRGYVFSEGMQLLPELRSLWSHAMAAVLMHIGDGKYYYGSPWNLESPREHQLAELPGVRVLSIRAISVYAVDFGRWNSWEHYLKSVSSNAKRNAKRAKQVHDDLSIQCRSGYSTIMDIGTLLLLRKQVYDRKRIYFSWVKFSLRLLIRIAVMRQGSVTALAKVGQSPTAAFGGIITGQHTYYLEGGTVKKNNGVSWFLLLQMLHDAYERAPTGLFVTGYHYEGDVVSQGLDFFREQCAAIAHPTSEIIFSYDPRNVCR